MVRYTPEPPELGQEVAEEATLMTPHFSDVKPPPRWCRRILVVRVGEVLSRRALLPFSLLLAAARGSALLFFRQGDPLHLCQHQVLTRLRVAETETSSLVMGLEPSDEILNRESLQVETLLDRRDNLNVACRRGAQKSSDDRNFF